MNRLGDLLETDPLANACLILCAEVHEEPRILTFDEDFSVYRWARRRKFQILP